MRARPSGAYTSMYSKELREIEIKVWLLCLWLLCNKMNYQFRIQSFYYFKKEIMNLGGKKYEI